MIKKLLFSFFVVSSSAFVVAQNLEMQNSAGTPISNQTYYFYNTGLNLAETKFHVGNSSASAITFNLRMYEIANSVPEDWQACFGTSCYTATKNTSGAQIFSSAVAPAGDSYDTLKVAPFSFGWTGGEWGVWRVTVYDVSNVSDSATIYGYWQAGGKPTGDQNSSGLIDGNEIAGDANENGSIDGNEKEGDVNGDGIINVWEVEGDTNGNGIIDGNESPASVNELNASNTDLNVYPNPVNSILNIAYDIKESSRLNPVIDVFDVVGKRIMTHQLMSNKGVEKLDVSKMKSGIYFYTIRVGEQTLKTERVIIK